MNITVTPLVDGLEREACWLLYLRAFEHLRATAVQRHVMYRREFDEVMADPRVDKYVGRDGEGLPCAVATFTNDLESMPLISPDYFAARWPERYARGQVWYIGFVAVDPEFHGTSMFAALVTRMTDIVAAAGGVAAVDICNRNTEEFHLPRAILRYVKRGHPGVQGHAMDAQTYHAYEFPAVATAAGARRVPAQDTATVLDLAALERTVSAGAGRP